MGIVEQIRLAARQVITHQLLVSWLTGYKRPNDKIQDLVRKGLLITLKKGLYAAGPSLHSGGPERFLIGNHILGPSYISMDSALSFHGLVPERIYETTSVTTKSTRVFDTPLGRFSYVHLPLPYYAFGIYSVELGDDQHALIASKEKALCDKIVSTKGLLLRSMTQAEHFLLENLRMDETSLVEFDTKRMETWLAHAQKAESIAAVIKVIEKV